MQPHGGESRAAEQAAPRGCSEAKEDRHVDPGGHDPAGPRADPGMRAGAIIVIALTTLPERSSDGGFLTVCEGGPMGDTSGKSGSMGDSLMVRSTVVMMM